MPALIIDCPSCSRKLRVPDELLGKAVKCPTCEHTFQATAASESTTPSRVPTPAPETAASDTASAPFGAEEQRPPDQVDNARLCSKCGETNYQEATRCRFCGEVLED